MGEAQNHINVWVLIGIGEDSSYSWCFYLFNYSKYNITSLMNYFSDTSALALIIFKPC